MISWLILAYATSLDTIIIGRIIQGISLGKFPPIINNAHNTRPAGVTIFEAFLPNFQNRFSLAKIFRCVRYSSIFRLFSFTSTIITDPQWKHVRLLFFFFFFLWLHKRETLDIPPCLPYPRYAAGSAQ